MSYGYTDNVYSFIMQWEQPQAAIIKRYKMTVYEKVGKQPDIELFDMKTGKLFLKRVKYDLPEEELFIGNQITIFGRQMTLESFGDAKTQSKFATANLVAIVPFERSLVAFVLKDVVETQLQSKLEDIRMMALSRSDVSKLATLGAAPEAAEVLASPAVLAINIRAGGKQLSEDSFEAAMLQQLQGKVWIPAHGKHGQALNLLFSPQALPSARRTTARMQDCSVCVVKAHAVYSGHVPEIVSDIFDAGLQITAIKSLSLSRVESQEFLEVYKGVVPNFPALVDELCRSRVVAIEVCGEQAVKRLRACAGPIDFSIAKQIRPHTLRAKYGVDSVKNGVHVTDLPEDGVLESEYMFDILDRQ